MLYHDRQFLEGDESGSTAIISALHGEILYKDSKGNPSPHSSTYLRISDCRGTVTLHVNNNDRQSFIKKMHLIAQVCESFADHLEQIDVLDKGFCVCGREVEGSAYLLMEAIGYCHHCNGKVVAD